MNGAGTSPRWHVAGVPSGVECAAEIAQALYDRGLITLPRGPLTFIAPGVIEVSGRTHAVLPRAWEHVPPPEDRVKVLGTTLQVLKRYASASKKVGVSVSADAIDLVEAGDTGDLLGRVESGLSLIEDQRASGALVMSAVADDAVGRIDWRASLDRCAPAGYPGADVFPRLVHRRVRRETRHPLVRLHEATCLAASVELGSAPPSAAGLTFDRREVRAVLERARAEAFSDRFKRVVTWMWRYHFGEGARSDRPTLFSCLAARSFKSVWEHMLEETLGPTHAWPLPRGRYAAPAGGQTLQSGLGLIPDLVISEGERVFVLDAKDYEAGSFPPSSDLQKQILYRLLGSSLAREGGVELKKIRNAFLVPSKPKDQAAVEVLAVHDLELGAGPWAGIDWARVVVVGVNIERVFDAYAAERRDTELRAQLLGSIESCPSSGGSSAIPG